MTRSRENTRLLAVLGVAMTIAVGALVVLHHRLLVGWPVIGVLAVPWLAFTIALRVRQDTWGREGQIVDWWSIPHFVAGALFGLVGIGGATVAAIAIAWEAVELVARAEEYPANRVTDVALAISGWAAVNAIAGGRFAAW